MQHQLAADFDLGGEAADAVSHQRVVAQPRIGTDVGDEQVERVRDLQHDATAHQPAFVGKGIGQHLPATIHRADDVGGRNAHVVVEDVGKAAVVHRARGLDADAGRVHRHDEHADALVRRDLVTLGVAVGARREEHVLSPVGRGPDLLAVDNPLVAVEHGAGAQRREVAAGVGLAVAHAVHRLTALDFRQVARALFRCAVHQQRIGLHRSTGARRFGAFHHFDETELLARRAVLSAVFRWPAHADPAGLAEIERE